MKVLHPHLEPKQHIIWDWNGTLLCDIEHAVKTTNRLLVEENLPTITLERYKAVFRFPVIEYYRDLGFDTSPDGFHDLCERFNHYFHEDVRACELWPGVTATLAHVKKMGKVQSILSASEQNLLNAQIRIFAIEAHFDHVMGVQGKAARSKLERGFDLMKKAGVEPAKTILIGDTDHDLEVAEALGIDAILVEHGHQAPERLRAVHHTVIKIY